ncbi:MAG: ATPase [Spirochaetaceae bacterium]|jgi:vacuolar-type H+-ATPase subunit E/Vma4|nr:ATPase [Spirochaetaceae bacterium]
MEEVQSTEVLDKEILEDARKKAYRILKAGEEALVAQKAEWEKREQAAITELHQQYKVRTEITRNEIAIRLPLDKKRMYSKEVERILNAAMTNYLNSLTREKLLTLLSKELRRQIAFCIDVGEFKNDEFALYTGGLDESEAETILKNVLPPGTWAIIDQSELPGDWHFPALVLEMAQVRITASVKTIAEALLQDKRAELVTALLGNEC